MEHYTYLSITKLKETIYNSYIHDAIIKTIQYSDKNKEMLIELYNPIFNYKYTFVFKNIDSVIVSLEEQFSSSMTILSMTVEDDLSIFANKLNIDCLKTSLYVVLCFFSGYEIHIACKDVFAQSEEQS